jgi:NCS1 family nucleobase:cation symporter-1
VGYSALLGAVGGVLICDYWLLRRTRLRIDELFRVGGAYHYDRGFNWCAILAMCLAIVPVLPGFLDVVSRGHVLATDNRVAGVLKTLYNYSWFVTFALAFVLYAVFMANHRSVREER